MTMTRYFTERRCSMPVPVPNPDGKPRRLFKPADGVWFGIQGIWNLIFTLSNLALFLFLPFAYLLCESEGFIGAKVSFPSLSHRIFVFRYLSMMPWASSDLRLIFCNIFRYRYQVSCSFHFISSAVLRHSMVVLPGIEPKKRRYFMILK
jgi:hypothetical protein